jgi:hypothetical protein
MISDAYYSVNRNFIPNEEDVHDYLRIHDRDKDGRLTLADLERSCIQYLCGVGGAGMSIVSRGGEERVTTATRTMAHSHVGHSHVGHSHLTNSHAGHSHVGHSHAYSGNRDK